MWGGSIGELRIVTKSEQGNYSLPLWNRNKNYGDFWYEGEVTVSSLSGSKYQIGFEGIVGNSYDGDIAIDDVSIQSRTCPSPGFCDFETQPRFCTWFNIQVKDQFDWEEGSGESNYPSIDHTFNNKLGHYMFLELSDPRKVGDEAWLSSTIFEVTKNRCMRFWYSINGGNVGSVKIDIVYENNYRETLWRQSKDGGDQWLEATVPFDSKNKTYRIYIVGAKGVSDKGHIAVDDISFAESTCGLNPSDAKNDLSTIPPTTTTTTLPPSTQINCNFDSNDACGWTNDQTGAFTWKVKKGSTATYDTGPTTDVSGKGYYIYVDASKSKLGDKGRILSPEINSTLSKNSHCLQFYYHLYGDEIGQLNIQLNTPGGLTGNPIWQRTTQHGNLWLKAHVTIPPAGNFATYQIAFEAIVGKGKRGDVALDEIVFTPNKRCSPVSEFGSLVAHYCDFEDAAVCGYQIDNATANNGRWVRAKPTATTVPSFDNTYQTVEGYFMRYEVRKEKKRKISKRPLEIVHFLRYLQQLYHEFLNFQLQNLM